jgi:hypothetical protein
MEVNAARIRDLAEAVLRRPEFGHMDADAKEAVAQKLVRVADPTDPRNLLTSVLLSIALMHERRAEPGAPPPASVRAPLSTIAAMPAFQRFAESIAGPAGILAAPSGRGAAHAELSAALAAALSLIPEAL